MTRALEAIMEHDNKGHILELWDKMSQVPDTYASLRPQTSPRAYSPDCDMREINTPIQVTIILRFFYHVKINLTQVQK